MLFRCKLHACNPFHERYRDSANPYRRVATWNTASPDTRDDISMESTRPELDAHGHAESTGQSGLKHTRDSFATRWNYGGNERAMHGTTRINLHLRYPRGRHANSLSYCTPRRILATYHKFPASRSQLCSISCAHCARSVRTLLHRTRIPQWIAALDVCVYRCIRCFFLLREPKER